MDKKSNSAFWLEAIGILVGGFSLFSLANSIFEFGLSNIFDRLTIIYQSIFHPIVGVIEPLFKSVANLAGWTLPPAWQDLVVFYLIVAGAVTRVHARGSGDGLVGLLKMVLAVVSGLLWVLGPVLLPIILVMQNERVDYLQRTYSHYKEVFAQILYALIALMGFLAINTYGP